MWGVESMDERIPGPWMERQRGLAGGAAVAALKRNADRAATAALEMGPYGAIWSHIGPYRHCLLYTSDAADE